MRIFNYKPTGLIIKCPRYIKRYAIRLTLNSKSTRKNNKNNKNNKYVMCLGVWDVQYGSETIVVVVIQKCDYYIL